MTILSPAQIKQGLANAGVSQNLDVLTAVILAESGGDTNATNAPSSGYWSNGTYIAQPGAYGIGQFTPDTAASLGYTPQQLLDPTTAFQAIAKLSNYGANLTPWDAYSFVSQNGVEVNQGPGQGSFQNFLGLVDSTTPIAQTTGNVSIGPVNIPTPSIPAISGLTSSIQALPQNVINGISNAISATIKPLQSYIQRVGFFIIGAGIVIAGLFILGSGNNTVTNVAAKIAPKPSIGSGELDEAAEVA